MRFTSIPLLAFVALRLAAQTPPPADPSFHASVNLVQVDAVVTDSKGNHIRDLKADDFEILEDGKPQKITNFSWIAVTSPPAAGTSPSSAGAPPKRIAEKQDIRRDIVLMVDDVGTNSEDLAAILSDMRRFVTGQVQPGDMVSVTASRGGMGFYSHFTNDPRQLQAAIDHIGRRPGWLICDESPPPLSPNWYPPDPRSCGTPNPIGYLTWAIQGLQTMPGRKAVVLFSHGFAAPPALVDLANRAGVVIYVIDPIGVPPFFNGSIDDQNFHPAQAVVESIAPYRLLARETGGLWIRSAPGKDLTEDLDKVLEDMSGYYLIGYQPDRRDFELVQGKPVRHDIQVRVARAGLTVRARNGFLGVPEAPAAKPQPRTTHDYLQEALASPFSAGSMRMQITPLYAASQPDPKTKLRHPSLHTILEVDGNDLTFADGEGGKKKLTENILVAVFNENGVPVASAERVFHLDATPEEAAKMIAAGFHASMDVRLPGPGHYQVRAAIRDDASGAVGSASEFLEVPDFNKPEISLSSIELSAPQVLTKPAKGDGASWAEYTAGSVVHFECDVLGVKTTAHPPKQPRVEMEVRLFHEGGSDRPVFDSMALPVSQKTLEQNFLAGQMRIGMDLEPGDYTMQLLVYDRLASPKKQRAVQWANLTVVAAK